MLKVYFYNNLQKSVSMVFVNIHESNSKNTNYRINMELNR
jgi:hypothetical protein